MSDKGKLKEIKKLADAMYHAAQYLTTDASRLHKAMDEYHQFVIHEYKEEPVSEELEEAIKVCSEKAMLHKAYTSSPFFSEEDYAKGFVDGKDWQKQQLMNQAIEVQVNPLLGETFVGCKVIGYEVGEKVKIIIIKED